MKRLSQFSQSRLSWALLLFSAFFLEASALFFQYVMKLDPCVMCIYQRLAVMGILIASTVGVLQPKSVAARAIGMALWGVSAIWGLQIAYELVDLQNNPSPFATCPFLPNFPEWFALHDWLPSVFMPTGMCSDIAWQFATFTMAEWMLATFVIYVLLWVVFIPATFINIKRVN